MSKQLPLRILLALARSKASAKRYKATKFYINLDKDKPYINEN